jgi:hypothetical protein
MASARKVIWRDVKVELDRFDRAGLLGLLKDLHGASRDNQAFLHARLGLGSDPLEPYKKTISRWIAPDVMKGQNVSIAKAKKAISDYKKAIGLPQGVAELSVFYCEEALSLLSWCGMDDEWYYAALVRMFKQALTAVEMLPIPDRASFYERLDPLRWKAGDFGWGVKEAFDELWHSVVCPAHGPCRRPPRRRRTIQAPGHRLCACCCYRWRRAGSARCGRAPCGRSQQ